MRARATYGLLIAAAVVGAAVVWWPQGDEPVSVVDTIDLTAQDDSDHVGGSELPASGDDETDPYDLVELRSAPGGVDLRVHRVDHFDSPCGYASVRVGVSTDLAVGIVEVRVPDGSDVRHLVSQIVGAPEDDYTVVIVGRVPAGTSEISAGLPDLAIFDRAEPVDGLVALALHSGSFPLGRVTVNLTGPDGAPEIIELATSDEWSQNAECDESPAYPDVAPPPSYPVSTLNPLEGDRPEDRAAIVEVYDFWYNADVPTEDKAGALDDPEGVVEAQLETQAAFGPTLATAVAVVDGVEFLSESEAAVEFHIDVGGTTMFVELGRALLIDGSWRITRDTVCPLIANAGVSC